MKPSSFFVLSLMLTAQTLLAQDGTWRIETARLPNGYGPGQAFGTVEYELMGNRARGRWAMGGGSQFSTEDITR